LRWVITAIVVLIIVVGLSALSGYGAGVSQRLHQATEQSAQQAAIQFQLGVEDLEAGRCELARTRFEYIIQKLDPSYPGVTEKLAEALLCTSSTATATQAAEPTASATPDLRDVEDIFQHAEQLLAAGEWTQLLETLDTIRGKNPDYMTVEVDGMYYLGLRNRGFERISVQGELEAGIYDLNRAEQFGPLDVEADSYRQWAIWYLTGLSFWEVDWAQALYYFSQLAVAAPNIFDSSMISSSVRFATAEIGYGEEMVQYGLVLHELRQVCEADAAFKTAQVYITIDPTVWPTAFYAENDCFNAQTRTARAP